VIRPPKPGDARRRFGGVLTPDGRYFAWLGPREPRGNPRLEVFELPSGRQVYSETFRLDGTFDPGVNLGPDGRGFQFGQTPFPYKHLILPDESNDQVRVRELTGQKWDDAVGFSFAQTAGGPWEDLDPRLTFGARIGLFGVSDSHSFRYQFPISGRIVVVGDSGVILLIDTAELERAVKEFESKTFR
jgi:hypothetical protein